MYMAPDSKIIEIFASLKAAAKQRDLRKGTTVHADILRRGLVQKNCQIGCALINMYAKCGALAKASEVLHELTIRDAVSWNSLIAGYTQKGQGEEALECFDRMQCDNVFPNAFTYTWVLKACGSTGAVAKGMRIHCEIVCHNLLKKDIILGTSLVDMYAKCGELKKALCVFDELPVRDVVSWGALISGLSQHGLGEEALKCFEWMQQEGLSPNAVTFLCILKACGSIGEVDKGKQIHKEVARQGLVKENNVLGNTLVDMYIKCSAVGKALQMADELPARDTISWNVLIAGYARLGKGEESLKCFKHMRHEGLSPNTATYTSVLKACSSIGAAGDGQLIHEEIDRQGLLNQDAMLGTSLVDMYAKCGAIEKATQLLESLPFRDVIVWNTVIAAYVQQEKGDEALKCLERMQLVGISPNTITFICILTACGNIGAIDKGEQIHCEIVREGLFGSSILLGNALVGMYAECAALGKATQVFDELSLRDTVTWSEVIAGYVQEEQAEKALKLFDQMKLEGLSYNEVTFTCILKACAIVGAFDRGKEIHKQTVRQGLLGKDIVLGNALVEMYARCAALDMALDVLEELPFRDIASWGALIAGYVEQGHGEKAFSCFDQMQWEGISPNMFIFTSMLIACGSSQAIDKGEQIHDEIAKRDLLGKDNLIGNTLVDMYAKCGAVDKAAEVLNGLPIRDAVTWNSLIVGYVQSYQSENALECYEKMVYEGLCPTEGTFVSILRACGSIGAVDKGKQIHEEIVRQGLLGKNTVIGNSLVDMYAKCGELSKAAHLLDELPIKDVVSWNALIAGYAQQGQGMEALKLFKRMQNEHHIPDVVTYICVLKACGSMGAFDNGQQIHDEVLRQGLLEKDIVLGTTLVDMYAKCGALERAAQLLSELPARNAVSWNALIAGYGQKGFGEEALNCFKQMQHEDPMPDTMTFCCMLSACSRSNLLDEGRMHFDSMSLEYGVAPDLDHYACMAGLFSRSGDFDNALTMIKRMPASDHLPVWRGLLGACRDSGNVQVGRLTFDNLVQLDEHDAVPYVLMSTIYAANRTLGHKEH